MSTVQGKKPTKRAVFENASMMTLKLDKQLQMAFAKVAAEKGTTASELLRKFMTHVVREAGHGDLLKSKFH